ncbi:MAG: hypothetical protein ABJH98_17430 [Reichenbachiella sp.]|uniref:hypothetical protein n=1 Tax=Reichenbachiella sp. TaxID=2184521 RepID=UPI0032979736
MPQSPEKIATQLKDRIKISDDGIHGTVIEGHATLSLPPRDQHYWSPQLSLSFESSETGSVLRGLYGPRPEVWTMFVLFYSIIGFAVLVILVIGYSNWTLGQSAQILWLVPALVGIFLTLYLVSYFGQKMGRKQIVTLHNFVEKALDVKFQE